MIENQGIPMNFQIHQGKGNVVSDMDGEKVMMNIANGSYYNLGVIGGRIWSLLDAPTSADELVRLLMAEYDVEQGVCKKEVVAFLQALLDQNLIYFGEGTGQTLPA